MDQDQKIWLQYRIAAPDAYHILMVSGYCEHRKLPDDQFPEGMMLSSNENGFGFSLLIAANTKLSKPVQIIKLFDDESDTTLQTRNRVIMEAGSSADLMICNDTLSGKLHSCHEIMDIALGEGATLNMVRFQNVNDATTLSCEISVNQAASSRMKTHFVSLRGDRISNRLIVKLS